MGDRADQDTSCTLPASATITCWSDATTGCFAPLERRFWYGLAAAIAVLSIAGLLVGIITRRALMSRVYSIRQTVSAIIHGDLRHRLPTHSSDDELNTLARTINGMLDQIEQLVHGVRNVSNSIAHDLRTPLAELRSRLEELALMRPVARDDLRRDRRGGRGRRSRDPHFRRVVAAGGNRRGLRRSGFVSRRSGRTGGGRGRVLRSRPRNSRVSQLALHVGGAGARARAIRCCSRRRSAI